MSERRIFGDDADRAAAEQLGLGSNYTIVFMANNIGFLVDDEDPVSAMEDGFLSVDRDEITQAIREAMVYVDLPKGWRLVGMRQADGDADTERTFGFVNLAGVGADQEVGG